MLYNVVFEEHEGNFDSVETRFASVIVRQALHWGIQNERLRRVLTDENCLIESVGWINLSDVPAEGLRELAGLTRRAKTILEADADAFGLAAEAVPFAIRDFSELENACWKFAARRE